MSTSDVTARCACCKARPTPGYRTCTRCKTRLLEALDDIADRWPYVACDLVAKGEQARRNPGFGSRPPVNIPRLALLDPKLMWSEPGDLRYPPDVVFGWADRLGDELGDDRIAYLDDAAKYMANNIAHITRQDWVDDLWDEIKDVRAQLGDVSGAPRRRYIGPCPNPTGVSESGTLYTYCEAKLYAPVTGDLIRCRACGQRWERPEWNWLGTTIKVLAREAA